MRLAIVADDVDGALHGLDGTYAWGEARTVAGHPADADVVVHLAEIAGPWPAADRLWELPAAGEPRALVVGDDTAEVVAALRRRGVPVDATPRLTFEHLRDATVVAFTGPPGGPPPASALAVCAARRLLVIPRAEPTFGLVAGVDHLAHAGHDLADPVDMATTHPGAFDPLMAMGRLAAAAHRASAVYGRFAVDRARS